MRITHLKHWRFRIRSHLLRLAVLTLAILPFASAIAIEESPVSLNLCHQPLKKAEPFKSTLAKDKISRPHWLGRVCRKGQKASFSSSTIPTRPIQKRPR